MGPTDRVGPYVSQASLPRLIFTVRQQFDQEHDHCTMLPTMSANTTARTKRKLRGTSSPTVRSKFRRESTPRPPARVDFSMCPSEMPVHVQRTHQFQRACRHIDAHAVTVRHHTSLRSVGLLSRLIPDSCPIASGHRSVWSACVSKLECRPRSVPESWSTWAWRSHRLAVLR